MEGKKELPGAGGTACLVVRGFILYPVEYGKAPVPSYVLLGCADCSQRGGVCLVQLLVPVPGPGGGGGSWQGLSHCWWTQEPTGQGSVSPE